jgi:hypothetical protein
MLTRPLTKLLASTISSQFCTALEFKLWPPVCLGVGPVTKFFFFISWFEYFFIRKWSTLSEERMGQ